MVSWGCDLLFDEGELRGRIERKRKSMMENGVLYLGTLHF